MFRDIVHVSIMTTYMNDEAVGLLQSCYDIQTRIGPKAAKVDVLIEALKTHRNMLRRAEKMKRESQKNVS